MTPSGDRLDRRPVVERPDRLGIGVFGSGGIVEHAHLPSYRAAGYRVAAIASNTPENAAALAKRARIERAHASLDDLLGNPEVDVVDIAVPPDFQPDIALRAIAAGKHVLAQKPLATTFRDAVAIVEAADAAGVRLAVNQNGRWDPSINGLRTLLADGLLGERWLATMTMHITMPWQRYYREPRYDRLMVMHMSVHHLDQLRFLFGDPARVSAFGRTISGQEFAGETIAHYRLEFDDGFFAAVTDDGTNWSRDLGISYRLQGSEAVVKGEIGWPHLTYSTLSYQLRETGEWTTPEFSRQWFPDAFAATMGELLASLETEREPSNSGRDNLATMRLVLAAYRSMAESRTIAPDEVTADRD